MQRNVASQKITVLAIDTATGLPKTGDAGNITLYYNGDDGGVTIMSTNSGHPTEDESTNAPGVYSIAMTQGETNYAKINVTGKSSTSGIRVIPVLNLQTVPAAFILAGGAAGGLAIAGSNAATTFATLTVTGAVAFQSTFAVTTSTSLAAPSATTVTFSGAVAFQSTFAVTTSTALGALSCTTLTASGAVAFQSTFIVTGAVTFSSTFATTGTVTLNALTVTNATTLSGAVSFGSTWTVTGAVTFTAGLTSNITGTLATVTTLTNLPAITAGWLTATGIAADAITAAKIADGAIDTATFATGTTIPRCTLVDTTTVNTDMRGTNNAALAATALSTAQWTNALATLLGGFVFTVPGFVDANIQYVNDVAVAGTGAPGFEWGPA